MSGFVRRVGRLPLPLWISWISHCRHFWRANFSQRGLCRRAVSIRLSVCLSVLPINDYDDDCVEMAKHIEKHFSPLRSLVIPAMFAIGFVDDTLIRSQVPMSLCSSSSMLWFAFCNVGSVETWVCHWSMVWLKRKRCSWDAVRIRFCHCRHFDAQLSASAAYAVMLCPSVCLSVTLVYSKTFLPPYVAPLFQFFFTRPRREIPRGVTPAGTPNTGVVWKIGNLQAISRCTSETIYCSSGVFRISEGGETPRWWGAGEGAVPSPQKKNSFLRPEIIILGAFWHVFFISYRCNNRVQNPFSVPYDLLRVFEDDNTTI